MVKLFTPDAAVPWLLTELDPEDSACATSAWAFRNSAACISEIESVRGRPGSPLKVNAGVEEEDLVFARSGDDLIISLEGSLATS